MDLYCYHVDSKGQCHDGGNETVGSSTRLPQEASYVVRVGADRSHRMPQFGLAATQPLRPHPHFPLGIGTDRRLGGAGTCLAAGGGHRGHPCLLIWSLNVAAWNLHPQPDERRRTHASCPPAEVGKQERPCRPIELSPRLVITCAGCRFGSAADASGYRRPPKPLN